MTAVRFICKTDNKIKHEEIKRKTYAAWGAIVMEKIYRDTSLLFEAEMEIVSEGGTLYRDVEERGLTKTIRIIS